jgi:hypothetical protein
MTGADETNKIGVMRLVAAMEAQASFAVNRERLPPELRGEFERAGQELLPALRILVHVLDRAEYPEDAYQALWCLISSTATLIDPNGNKLGIAAALKSATAVAARRSRAIKERARLWQEWKKPVIRAAIEICAKNPNLSDSSIAKLLPDRVIIERKLPGEKEIRKLLSKWRPKLKPKRK